MTLYSWNVNGFRAIVKKGFFQHLKNWNPDIICLQEVKLNHDQIDSKIQWDPFVKTHYYTYWHNGNKLGYSGVAVFSKLKAEKVSYQFREDIKFFNQEGRILELDYGSWVLFNIYFPNGHARKEEQNVLKYKLYFFESFLNHLESIRKSGKSIIACGDYNVAHKPEDLANPKENEGCIGFLPEERIYLSRFIELGYLDVFRYFYPDLKDSYTWWSYIRRARDRNIGWRLDYFFTSLDLTSSLVAMEHKDDIMGSDHCPIYLKVDLKRRKI